MTRDVRPRVGRISGDLPANGRVNTMKTWTWGTKRYVSAQTLPIKGETSAVVLALYGPRGGTVCTAELSPSEARALIGQLVEAVALFERQDRLDAREQQLRAGAA